MKANPIPMELVKESFEIDSSCPSGLRWKTRPRHHFNSDAGWLREITKHAGKPAGAIRESKTTPPRYYVCVSYFRLQTARIIYAIYHGIDPGEMDIDHIDGNPLNNFISNLRLASRMQNGWNRRNKSNNKSGYSGVFFCNQKRKWCARIVVNKKMIHLGFVDCLDDAIAKRKAAEAEYHSDFSKQKSRTHEAHEPTITTP
jgi:hypothetical protein